MQSLGYGPAKHLPLKIAARNLPDYRDAASLLIDQLKEIYIDTELELVETANWLPKLIRSDFVLAQSVAGAGIDGRVERWRGGLGRPICCRPFRLPVPHWL